MSALRGEERQADVRLASCAVEPGLLGLSAERPERPGGRIRETMSVGDFLQAVKTSELPAGAKQAVELAGQPILVCNSNGKIFAVSNICSHAQEMLDCGRMGNGWIACPIHGARFDLATGAAKNPPATRPIPVFETRIEGDWIEVKL